MDSMELLAREDEFKKLNKQLEMKTQSLMKEIEKAMQKPDIFSEISHLSLQSAHSTPKKHCCSQMQTTEMTATKNNQELAKNAISPIHNQKVKRMNSVESLSSTKNVATDVQSCTSVRNVCSCRFGSKKDRVNDDLEFLYAFVSVSVQEKVLPEVFVKDRVTVEGVCRFLSSKVKLMQEQIDKQQAAINLKASQCELHLSHQAELESERMSLLNSANNLKAASYDIKAKFAALQKRFEEKDRQSKEHRSECDRLTNEVKQLRSRVVAAEARAASQTRINEDLRHQIESAKTAEKEFRESTRALSSSHESAISRLEGRLRSVCTLARKQDELVHNLRRQVALLTTGEKVKNMEYKYRQFVENYE